MIKHLRISSPPSDRAIHLASYVRDSISRDPKLPPWVDPRPQLRRTNYLPEKMTNLSASEPNAEVIAFARDFFCLRLFFFLFFSRFSLSLSIFLLDTSSAVISFFRIYQETILMVSSSRRYILEKRLNIPQPPYISFRSSYGPRPSIRYIRDNAKPRCRLMN